MSMNTIVSTNTHAGNGVDKNFKLTFLDNPFYFHWITSFEVFTWFTVKPAFMGHFYTDYLSTIL